MRLGHANRASFLRASLLVLLGCGLLAGCSTAALPTSPYYSPDSAAPTTSTESHSAVTTASWYGPGFNGRRTASGEVFHQTGLTAASRTLPLGSHVKVTSLANGRSVIVRINDRGPFVAGRSIDLSRVAAERIGMVREGVGKVKIAGLDDRSAQVAAVPAPTSATTPVSYRGLSATSFPLGTWLEPAHESIWHRKMVRQHSHYRLRNYQYRARVISDPVGTWLRSALPRL